MSISSLSGTLYPSVQTTAQTTSSSSTATSSSFAAEETSTAPPAGGPPPGGPPPGGPPPGGPPPDGSAEDTQSSTSSLYESLFEALSTDETEEDSSTVLADSDSYAASQFLSLLSEIS